MSFFFGICSFPDVLLAVLGITWALLSQAWVVFMVTTGVSGHVKGGTAAEHDPEGQWPPFETSIAPPHSAILCAECGLRDRPGERLQHRRRVNHNVTSTSLSRPRPPSEGGRLLSYQEKLQRFSTPTSEWLLLKATEVSQKVSLGRCNGTTSLHILYQHHNTKGG